MKIAKLVVLLYVGTCLVAGNALLMTWVLGGQEAVRRWIG